MKKTTLLSITLAFIVFAGYAQTVITPNKDTVIAITTLTVKPYKAPVIIPPPPPADFGTLNAAENSFDYVWSVYGLPVGSEVNKLITKKGIGVDITYKGRVATIFPGQNWAPLTMDGKLPSMVDPYFMSINNRPSLQYESNPVSPINPPYEIWFVFRTLPSATYEALFEDGYGSGYVANNGGDGVRIINAQTGQLPTGKWPSLYATHIGRLVIASQSSASLYFDNVFQGTKTITSADYNLNHMSKTVFNVAVTTNNMDWDFAAMYFKSGLVTDPSVYTSLAAKWNVGSLPSQILLNNLGWTKTNGIYTPQATIFYTPSGVTPADPSKWDYEWYYWIGSTFLNVQTLFSTKYQVTPADFPAGYATMGGFTIKLRMRPKDSNGNAWRWFESNGQAY